MTLVIFKAISGSTRWEKWRLSRCQRRVASHAICNFSSFFIKMRPHPKHCPHPHFSLMTRLPIALPLPTPLISPQSSNLAGYHSSIVKLRRPPPRTHGSWRRRGREHRRRTRRQQQRVRFRFGRRQTRWLHVGDPRWMGFRSVILHRSPQNDYTGTRARGRGKETLLRKRKREEARKKKNTYEGEMENQCSFFCVGILFLRDDSDFYSHADAYAHRHINRARNSTRVNTYGCRPRQGRLEVWP